MAHAANSDADDDKISIRIARLNLPLKPMIMDKHTDRRCPHRDGECLCYEYTTMLDRHEYSHKWLAEDPELDPEPEVKKAPKPVNGTGSANKKKLTLADYKAGKTAKKSEGDKEKKTNGTSPVVSGPTSAPAQSTAAASGKPPAKVATPKIGTGSDAPGPSPLSRSLKPPLKNGVPSPRPPQERERPNSVGRGPAPSARAPSSVSSKRSTESISNSPKNSRVPIGKAQIDSIRPKKRQRTPSPAPQKSSTLKPPKASPRPPPPPLKQSKAPPSPVLPPMLSPTLPPHIEAALAAEDKKLALAKEERPKGTLKPPSRVRSTSSAAEKPVSRKTVASGKKPLTVSSAFSRGEGVKGVSAGKAIKAQPASRNASPAARVTKPATKHPPTEHSKPSLIVVLKFPKRRYKDVITLQKLAGPAKRQRQEDDTVPTPPTKRPKPAPASLNVAKAASSKSPAFKSPALKVSKGRESTVSTPQTKKTNGTLRRSDSSSSIATPLNRDREEKNGMSREPSRISKDDPKGDSRIANAFDQEFQKYSDMGKKTKHEADRVFKSETPSSEADTKQATVTVIDATMCFLLAFHLNDRARSLEKRSMDITNWRSLVPLILFCEQKARTQNHVTLLGFIKQLEAIIRQHIYDIDVYTFNKTPLPDTSLSKAPTPDASHSKGRDSYDVLKNHVVRGNEQLKACWLEGMKKLTYEDIQLNFPQTFAGRSKWVDPATAIPKKPGKYAQSYQLPLHRYTSPMEALNFGRKFLEEWAAANGVKYSSKIGPALSKEP